jgi:hypothetical protein
MERAAKEAWIRQVARRSRAGHDGILWSRHAIAKLALVNLSRPAVEEALAEGEVIEDYPAAHRALPDCLVLFMLSGTEAIHAVIAIDMANDRIFVVTLYRPDPLRWLDERTRKPR